MEVALAGEGPTDLAVMRRLLSEAQLEAGDVLWGAGRSTGKQGLLQRLQGYAAGALHGRAFFVMLDLDGDAPCPSALLAQLRAAAHPRLCLRVAVRAVESWLIADRDALAGHLAIDARRLEGDPEALADPKRRIVDACQHSRRAHIRKGLCPRPDSGRAEGPDYAEVLTAFACCAWSPERAAAASASLAQARQALGRLRSGLGQR